MESAQSSFDLIELHLFLGIERYCAYCGQSQFHNNHIIYPIHNGKYGLPIQCGSQQQVFIYE